MKNKKKINRKNKLDIKRYINKEKMKQILKVINWMAQALTIFIAIISVIIEIKVKEDTAELTKFSDKPIYYKIRIYPTNKMYEYEEGEKTIRLNLNLVVDDFEIANKNLKNVNYNDRFTHKKYFIVYDYELGIDKNTYKYFRTRLDEKTEASLRLSKEYTASITEANYSKTPNNKYIYMLIYTETQTKENLDLVFFDYLESENGLILQYITNENGDTEICTELIDSDANICKDYFIQEWAQGDLLKQEDLEFMFDVYNDLKAKIIEI